MIKFIKKSAALIFALASLLLISCGTIAEIQHTDNASGPEQAAVGSAAEEPAAGFSMFENIFLPAASGELGNSLKDLSAALAKQGITASVNQGRLYAEETEEPGSYINCILTGESGSEEASVLMYGLVSGDIERRAIVSFIDDSPAYYIDAVFYPEGASGTEVSSLDELIEYIKS